MANNRERSGAIIEKIKDQKTGRESALRLDKRLMMFFARIPDADLSNENRATRLYFESKNGDEVKAWLKKELAKTLPGDLLKWIPCIDIKIEDEDRWFSRSREGEQRKVGITITVDRFWIALTTDKKQWLSLPWAACDEESATMIAPEDRVRAAKNFRDGPQSDSVVRHHGNAWVFPSISGDRSYLEYTPDLWAGIQHVIDTIEQERAIVRGLLSTKKGVKQLIEVGSGAKRLGAGSMQIDEPNTAKSRP